MFRSIVLVSILCLITSTFSAGIRNNRDSNEAPKCITLEEKLLKKCLNAKEFYESKSSISFRGIPWDIDWSNVVIIMIIHNSPQVDSLIRAHFNTWLKQTDEGLDVVFVTDIDDTRSTAEILPYANNVLATTHLYKSPAPPEGKHIRFKVRDAFRQIATMFKDNYQKKYFIKMDVDTFLLAEHLLNYMKKINEFTYGRPLLFGKGVCSPEKLCYAGGALYGMNRFGLMSINSYFESHPNVHEEEHFPNNGRKVNMMIHEDYMVSYVYRSATNYPVLSNDKIFNYFIKREGLGSELSPPICYHQVKQESGFYEYYTLFYDTKQRILKPLSSVVALWNEAQLHHPEYFPFLSSNKLPKWD